MEIRDIKKGCKKVVCKFFPSWSWMHIQVEIRDIKKGCKKVAELYEL